MYRIDNERFNNTFFSGKSFRHTTLNDKCRYRLFPFSSNTSSSNVLDTFDDILGPFIRAVFGGKSRKILTVKQFLIKYAITYPFLPRRIKQPSSA